ncbi:MAG: MotA/TolQ/ExbB proton channel family protein [Armatimonadetes bacterium]|nr:MotA/TolQ/ExbB proton channel family protein [Armatimonadota bacterium]
MNEWMTAHNGLVGLGIVGAKYTLILFSVVSVAVMIERVLVLRRLRRLEESDFTSIRAALIQGDGETLRAIALSSAAPSAGVLATGLEFQDAGEARVREAMNQEVSVQIAALQHNLPILATAASTAPYIGLFGTVLGILSAFRDIAESGQAGASIVAGGISEALIATALGLGVAIPAVIAYNYFSARVNALSLQIETHALDLAERMVKRSAHPSAPSQSGAGKESHANRA